MTKIIGTMADEEAGTTEFQKCDGFNVIPYSERENTGVNSFMPTNYNSDWDIITVNQIIENHGIYKLPEAVYQIIWSIAKAMGTVEDKQHYMRQCLHDFIKDKHPGFALNVFMDLTRDEAKAIHIDLSWGLYYTLARFNECPAETPVPIDSRIKALLK